MRFIDVFLLHCLLADSPPDTPAEIGALARNQHRTAARGREPGLLLEQGDSVVTLADWAGELLAQCQPIAQALDQVLGGQDHGQALAAAQASLAAPDSLPSARVLQAMQQDHDNSYTAFVRACSERSRQQLLALPWPEARGLHYAALAEASLAQQRQIEQADSQPFEAWRQAYLAPEGLGV